MRSHGNGSDADDTVQTAARALKVLLDRTGQLPAIAAEVKAELKEELKRETREEMTKEETAEHLRVPMRTLELWMRPRDKGGQALPYYKLPNGQVIFTRASLAEWRERFMFNRPIPMAA